MLTIRKCQSGDVKAVRELVTSVLNEEFPKEAQAYPTNDLNDILDSYGKLGEAFFVATIGDQVVGTVGIKREDERVALLRRLFVAQDCRRKKVGVQLLERAIDFCREVGYDEVIIKTTSTMDRAVQLCEKRGFIPRARLSLGSLELLKLALFLKDKSFFSKGETAA